MAKSAAHSNKTLRSLCTALGKRSVYNSVAHCNRCGLCAAVCPVYAKIRQESFSPRGRNQALRLMLEGKLNLRKNKTQLKQLAYSCTLCGQCSQVCPGQIPTVQHVLELRRRLSGAALPSSLFKLMRLRETSPRLFAGMVRGGLMLHRAKLLPGFSWLKFLKERLPRTHYPAFNPPAQQRPTLIYLPSFEAQFLRPDIAQQTYTLAAHKYHPAVWLNTASGLFEYVYGDLPRARKLVRCLLTRHARTGNGKLPLLIDSTELYEFLQQAPAFFDGFDTWQRKAEHFVSCLRFVTDLFPKKLAAAATPSPVLFMSTSLLGAPAPLVAQTQEILHTLFKKNFVQCEYTSACLPPFGYGLGNTQAVQGLHLSAVGTVARHQTRTVVVCSVGTALEMEALLHRFYPSAQVRHVAHLTDNVCNLTTKATS
ncbi:MAG: (Fe-S)-binding protein [Elusimicrobiaceae bacterium]|nr:(Fe-S)-binding protein [Elusimicrobiaceae bacterium]